MNANGIDKKKKRKRKHFHLFENDQCIFTIMRNSNCIVDNNNKKTNVYFDLFILKLNYSMYNQSLG